MKMKQIEIDFGMDNHADNSCRIAANEGLSARAYNHPKCGTCKRCAYDKDKRANICTRTGAMVFVNAWCSKWVRA